MAKTKKQLLEQIAKLQLKYDECPPAPLTLVETIATRSEREQERYLLALKATGAERRLLEATYMAGYEAGFVHGEPFEEAQVRAAKYVAKRMKEVGL